MKDLGRMGRLMATRKGLGTLGVCVGLVSFGGAPVKEIPYNSGYLGANARSKALEEPNFETCGMSCSYHKANEAISLQASYLFKKYEFLRENHSKREKFAVLGDYCTPQEQEAADGYSLSICLDRFRSFYDVWSFRARGVMGRNETVMAGLECRGGLNKSGVCEDPGGANAVGFEIAPNKNSGSVDKWIQAPYFPTVGEIQKISGALPVARLENVLQDFSPRMEDFIDFVPMQDPVRPQTTLHVSLLDPKQKPQLNAGQKEAYTRALGEFKQIKADLLEARKEKEKKQAGGKGTGSYQSDPALVELGRVLNEAIYNEARRDWVEHVKSFIYQTVPFTFSKEVSYSQKKAPMKKGKGVGDVPSSLSGRSGVLRPDTTGNEAVPNIKASKMRKGQNSGVNIIHDSYSPDGVILPAHRISAPDPEDQAPAGGRSSRTELEPSNADDLRKGFQGP